MTLLTFRAWSCWNAAYNHYCRVIARTRAEAQEQAAILLNVPALTVDVCESIPFDQEWRIIDDLNEAA